MYSGLALNLDDRRSQPCAYLIPVGVPYHSEFAKLYLSVDYGDGDRSAHDDRAKVGVGVEAPMGLLTTELCGLVYVLEAGVKILPLVGTGGNDL